MHDDDTIYVAILLMIAIIAGFSLGVVSTTTNVKPDQFDRAKKSCVEIEWVSPFDFKCKTIDREGNFDSDVVGDVKELVERLTDMAVVLKSLEWYMSGDTTKESFKETFESKFGGGR